MEKINYRKNTHNGRNYTIPNYEDAFEFEVGTIQLKPLKSFFIEISTYLIYDNLSDEEIHSEFKKIKNQVKKFTYDWAPLYNFERLIIFYIKENKIGYNYPKASGKSFTEININLFVPHGFPYDKNTITPILKNYCWNVGEILTSNDKLIFKR